VRDVDVCTLLPAKIVGNILNRKLEVVGVQYGAAQVPTLRCLFGDEFAVPQVTVELAVGPVAPAVFEDAYGDPAGGDPVFFKRIGDGAFLRSEKGARTFHIYANGSVLSLQLRTDPAKPVARSKLITLAGLAAERLPENPRLGEAPQDPTCDKIGTDDVGAAVGAAPSLVAGLAGPYGGLACSWASRPGAATATIIRSGQQVAAYRRNLDDNLYVEVGELATSSAMTVLSRSDRAGDLVVFDGRDAMAVIEVIPSAGYADGATATTPGESALAADVIALL
jgi:hypothetical protein